MRSVRPGNQRQPVRAPSFTRTGSPSYEEHPYPDAAGHLRARGAEPPIHAGGANEGLNRRTSARITPGHLHHPNHNPRSTMILTMNRTGAVLLTGLVTSLGTAATPARAQDPAAAPPAADSTHPQAAEAYELPDVEEQPEFLNRADMVRAISRNYPREMRRRHLTGVVAIRMLVRRDGTVDAATITAIESTQTEFAAAAVKIVRAARFRPARVGGQPVPVWIMFPVTFWTGPYESPPPYHPPPLLPRP